MEAISFNSFSEALSSYFLLPARSFASFYIVSLQSREFGFSVSDLIGRRHQYIDSDFIAVTFSVIIWHL